MVKCLIDQSEHENEETLHKYLRKVRVKQADYYEQHYPRKDLLTGEKIEYKSFEQYFSAFFLNRNNMKKWFRENPDKSKSVALEMFKHRAKTKGWKKAPTEVELVSAGLPSLAYFNNNFDYKALCAELNLASQYNYSLEDFKFNPIKESIIIDTRENKPYKFVAQATIDKKLDFGDYALEGKETKFTIERKSLEDFIGSFLANYERVDREFQRAHNAGAHLIVVVEETLSKAMSFNYMPHITRHTRVRPEVVFHNVRELCQNYNCQFLFCDGRKEAVNAIEKIFGYEGDISKVDLEYYMHKAKLITTTF